MILNAAGQPIVRQRLETIRGWDVARTNRLNRAHWQSVTGNTINQDLTVDLETICRRAEYEIQNNAIIAGMVDTHATDVVGINGPTLQINSSRKTYNAAVESVWEEFAANPDLNGQWTLTDLLELGVIGWWISGDWFWQLVNGDPWTRLYAIAPRRVKSQAASATATMGIDRDKFGRPLAYHVEEWTESDLLAAPTGKFATIPAADMIHLYRPMEPGQARGVPWLAPCLETAGQIRDYDDQVMDAARAAADSATLLWTNHPDVDCAPVNESTTIERRTISTVPPGWQVSQLKAEQPTTTYREFRQQRLRELGRPAGMPLMMIELDSSNHNYSSARFDAQIYWRKIQRLQSTIAQKALTRILKLLIREGELNGRIKTRPPADLRINWTWQPPPHVDPGKEANAWETLLRIGICSLADARIAYGKDPESVDQRRAEEGLPAPDFGSKTAAAPVAQAGDVEELAGTVEDLTRKQKGAA